ncbi:MAG: SUMF1/EgtB/PvdO family nonheme iron enzyme [Planctomycetes bacterium]|nr:SUMF1/EgtB/PvdO family nonheme iron enzyme [Planctomycetota bacterium]
MSEPVASADDADLEALVARAIEAFEDGGAEGLDRMLAQVGDRAERLRTIVARVVHLGLVGEVGGVALPARFGDFVPRRELGRGGMGVVYEATDVRTQQVVALKVIRPELLASQTTQVRFRREVDAVGRLHHPAIVPVLASGHADGLPWYTMPRVPGATMADALARLVAEGGSANGERLFRAIGGLGASPAMFQGEWWQVGVRLVAMVAQGIAHAHLHGVVHRDVKPANVLLAADGRALVFDFGLAQVRNSTRVTRTGHEPGSPAYMAPEQLRGEPADERTDVYGLAATLWHFLALRPPFGDGELAEVAYRIAAGESERLPRALVPPALAAVLRRAIDRDRGHRHPGAEEFAADLAEVLAGRTPPVPGLPWRVRWRRRVARHRVAAGAGLGLVVLVPFVLAAMLWRERELGEQVRTEKARADATVQEFELLADVLRCQDLVAAAAALLPVTPQRRVALVQWLADADSMLARREHLGATVARLAQQVDGGSGTAERFLHDALASLLQRLDGPVIELREDVRRRLRWAEQVAAATERHPLARFSWAEARAAVRASPRYAGVDLGLAEADGCGLVPLGPNPATGLWEFYDLASAWDGDGDLGAIALPRHRVDGGIDVDGGTGIVFVLLPGGTFGMGAQNADPNGSQYDAAVDVDAPLHQVTLAPFLMARHELTQGQWRRLARIGASLPDPSLFAAGQTHHGCAITAAHPVENVDWTDASALLSRHGMALPTEAQWEYAARAGTSTPFWVPAAELPQAANVADQKCLQDAGPNMECEPWSDGFAVHAPVGSLRANAFGLFDTAGNVFEWCRDEFGDYRLPCDGREGLRRPPTVPAGAAGTDPRRAIAVRGGSWLQRAEFARSAWRNGIGADQRLKELGCRAMRPIR